jgi:hypothetical protein
VDVMVLRDISDSTSLVRDFPQGQKTLQAAVDEYLRQVAADSDNQHKQKDDKIGIISFAGSSLIDAMPNTQL